MKRFIYILGPVLFLLILFNGYFTMEPAPGFPSQDKFMELLRHRDPGFFLEELASGLPSRTVNDFDIREVIRRLDEVLVGGNGSDQATANGILGGLYLNSGYYFRGMVLLETCLQRTSSEREKRSVLFQKAVAQKREKDLHGLAITVNAMRDLKISDEALDDLEEFLEYHREDRRSGGDSKGILYYLRLLFFWSVLLILPPLISEIRVFQFRRRFPKGSDRIAAFSAFRRSPVSLTMSLASAICLFLFRIPESLGIPFGALPAVLHLMTTYTICLWSHFRIDSEIRNTRWTFSDFIFTIFRFNFLMMFPFLVFLIVLYILRLMTINLPMWPILSPLGIGFGFPALGGVLLLLLPLLFPKILGFTLLSEGDTPGLARKPGVKYYIWYLPESGIYNAFAYGYLSSFHSIVLTSPLMEVFPKDEVEAVLAHEEGHLELGHLFLYFLTVFDVFLLFGLFAARCPIEIQRILLNGPSVLQLFGFFLGYIVYSSVFLGISRQSETAADWFAAERVGRERWIDTLTHLTEANFLPSKWREADNVRISHPSLQTRRENLRSVHGEYFEPSFRQSPTLLNALWRSRLETEWRAGVAAATDLCALDDELEGVPPEKILKKIAGRHVEFGSECLVWYDGKTLEIIRCAQKACALSATPPLPADKICSICSSGMRKALGRESTWAGSTKGCKLEIK